MPNGHACQGAGLASGQGGILRLGLGQGDVFIQRQKCAQGLLGFGALQKVLGHLGGAGVAVANLRGQGRNA